MKIVEKPRVLRDPWAVEPRIGSGYPPVYAEPCRLREKRFLGEAVGLTQFGVNLTRLPPGFASGQRHWHGGEDEFVYVLEGELILVTDAGETPLGPGMAVGFRAGVADGHHLVNRSDRDAIVIEVGTKCETDPVDYPDIDMKAETVGGRRVFTRKDGTPF